MMAALETGSDGAHGRAPDRFNTKRLLARRVETRDRPHFQRLYTDRDVARTIGGVRDAAWIAGRHDAALSHWAAYGFGEYLLFDRVTSEFVGRIFLRAVTVADAEQIEVGYAFLPQYWNRGFGTEAAEAALDIGFVNLGLSEIIAMTLTTNRASQRVMEKIGMVFSHEAEHAGSPHAFYKITR